MRGITYRNIALFALLMVCIPFYAYTFGNDSIHTIVGVEVNALSKFNGQKSLSPQYSISSADFSRLNISDITSALRHLPGIAIRDYGGAGGMKTVSVRGLGSRHTGVALDGLLLPDAQSGQIDLQQFQISEISSLSLSIGGLSDIFQPARNLSSGSLLSIDTGDAMDNSVTMQVGSWGYISPSARVHHNINNVSLELQGGYTKAENNYPFTIVNGVDTHRENRSNSRLSQGNLNGSVLWHIMPESIIKTSIRLFDDDRQLPGLVRLYTNENDETLRDRGVLAQTMLITPLASRLWLKSGVRWNWTQQIYHNGIPSGGIKSERYINREYYATSALLYQPLKGLDFDYSMDYFHNAMTTTLAANPNPKRNSWLQSLSGKWTNDHFSVLALVLTSNIDSEHHWSPSVSVSYKPFLRHDFRMRFSAKDIFRMPSMTELYYYHIGSPSLKPENTKQLNLGVTFQKTISSISVESTADIYINKVEDKIVAIPFNMFVWRYMNVESVLGRGADVTASLSYETAHIGSFSLSANYSYQRIGMKDVVVDKYEDYQIAYIPEHSGSATFAWLNPWCNISATLTGASKQWTTNEHNASIPAYREVALSLYRSFLLGKQMFDCSVAVQNLFNNEYCLIAHYPMPGRNVKMSITYKF